MEGGVGGGVAFLGVERSFCGRRWRQREADERVALALTQRFGLPEILGRVLAARGVGVESAESFLEPRLRDLLPDPSHLKDMDAAVDRLVRAIGAGEKVAVFGDYDVDGATSAALLSRFFAAIGAPLLIYVPDRQAEGYGPNAPALLRLKAQGVRVVVTVDCGITAHAALEAAAEAGLDVVVVDHHVAEPKLPCAVAVVNPNRLDEGSPHGHLAAVGVTFLLVVALNRALRDAGWPASRPPPDLMQWLDLVALGTVCDVVKLSGVNRALVAQGLKVMRQRRNPGIAALADAARLAERLDAYHAGFILGPRVNAGGRVGKSDLGARLLSTDDEIEARDIARQLEALNAERRAIEATVLEQAIEQVERAGASGPLVFAAGEGWHPGVIGIVASRLKERYNRPACVVAVADGIGKGSGRSVAQVALGPAVIAARQAGLLVNGGGHAMAAGFTAEAARLDELRQFLSGRIAEAVGARPLVPELGFDGALALGGATAEFCARLERLAPFGAGNSEPRFALPAVRVIRADVVGGSHVRCVLGDHTGNARLKGIAFRCVEGELGAALLRGGPSLHVAGHLRVETWQGQSSVQLAIEDAAPALG